jgi:phosphoribosylaminoimidazole-succinocarboxamide synthase
VTIFDICYKKDELGDPLINDYHAIFLGAATKDELDEMRYPPKNRIKF